MSSRNYFTGVTEGVYSSPNVSQPDLGFYPYYQVTFQSSTYLFSYQTMTFYEAEVGFIGTIV